MHTAIHKDTIVKARVNSATKHQAENVLKHLGISMSETINALLFQIKLTKSVPFLLKIPNAETIQAMRETEEDVGLIESKNLDELFDKLELKDAQVKTQKHLSKRPKASRKKR